MRKKKKKKKKIGAKMFKTNDVVKTYIIKYGIYANILLKRFICKSHPHFFI